MNDSSSGLWGGRRGRASYFVLGLLTGLLFILEGRYTTDAPSGWGLLFGLLAFVLLSLSNLSRTIQRLHDLGRPGWHVLLFAVPFYNLYLAVILLFVPGEETSNDYGPSLSAPIGGPAGKICAHHGLTTAADGRCIRCRKLSPSAIMSVVFLVLSLLCVFAAVSAQPPRAKPTRPWQ